MKTNVVKNLLLTPEEVAVITSLDSALEDIGEEDCDANDLLWAIARRRHQSGDITITYADEKK